MSTTFIRYPLTGGVPTYSTFSAFPASASDGTLGLALDTDILYAYNTGSVSWIAIGGPGNILSIGTIDSQTANANGAVIYNDQLIMQSASATRPGLMNNTTQSLSGNKTFTGTISASNLSGTNTGDVTLAAFGSSPSANGASLSGQALTLQPADATHPGGITTGSQTIAGAKTFSTSVTSPIFSSSTANPADAGQIRLANADLIEWRDSGNTANFTFSPNLTGYAPNAADMLLLFPSVGGKLTLQDTSFDGEMSAAGRLTFTGGGGGLFLNSSDVIQADSSSYIAMSSSNVNIGSGDALSGSNTGDVTLTAVGSSPNSQGADLSGQILTLQPADGTNPGLITETTQTIGGDKTFNGAITASNFTPLATASTVMTRDINSNVLVNNIVQNLVTTVTAAGTSTLTGASAPLQEFTGTTTQIVKLPDATTLAAGATYTILNRSTGIVTVKDNSSNTLQAMAGGSQAIFVTVDSSTVAGVWDVSYTTTAAANAITALTSDVTASGPGSVAATIASHAVTNSKFRQSAGLSVVGTTGSSTADVADIIGTANQVLRVNSGGTALAFGQVNLASASAVTGTLPNGNTTATNANTASAIVARDGSGNFIAGTITAALTGTASGNTTITPNNHGVVLSGSANVLTVIAPDASATKVLKSGGSSADPSWLAYDNANTASTLVFRDSSNNFSAGTITAALTGTASGNTIYTANQYGVVLSGSANTMSVLAPDSSTTKVLTSGGTSANPTWNTLSVAQMTIASSAISSTTIDWSLSNVYTKTLGANTTFTFSNQTSGQAIMVRLTNTVSNYTVTWPSVKWSGGSAPTMSTGAVSDVYTFMYDGTNTYGSFVQNMS